MEEDLEESAIADSEDNTCTADCAAKKNCRSICWKAVFSVDAGNPGAWTHYTTFPKNMAYF